MFHVPEQCRVTTGPMRSDSSYGNNGQFWVKSLKFKRALMVQASDGMGWEHVSVSVYDRTPTWEEMCFVKNLFWDENDVVVQFHPAKSDYVNMHKYCLHLWRKAGTNNFTEMPDTIMV
jgi:hypothetical protein